MRKLKMPLAFSYLRFSSPQQATGDSVRRQTDAREKWLAEHPSVTLDTTLKMTDAGRSAFKRGDWDTYALARFVKHVESGRVETGSYLLVENLDRLSREDAGTATELFLGIVNRGVVVVQLMPVVMEFRKPVNVQNLMFAIVELSRGNSESAAKSERVGAAWARKIKQAGEKVVTRRLPGWIDYADGKLSLDAEKAKTVRRIFRMAIDGHGMYSIARALNAEKVPVIGRATFKGRPVTWSTTTLHAIIRSPAAVGTYVPYRCRSAGRKAEGEPVPNYFPPVVDAKTFEAAQRAVTSRAASGAKGKRGKHVNIFAGLLADARGGSLVYRHHATQATLLIPDDYVHGKNTKWTSYRADDLETAVLSELREVPAAEVEGEGKDGGSAETLAKELADTDALIGLWEGKMDNPAIVDTVARKLASLNTKRRKLSEELATAQREEASPVAEAWGEFRSLADLLRQDNSPEKRLKVRTALRRSVERITCLFVANGVMRYAAVQVLFATGVTRDYLIVRRSGVGRKAKEQSAVSVISPAAAGLSTIDLSSPEHVARLERQLLAVPIPTAEPTKATKKGRHVGSPRVA